MTTNSTKTPFSGFEHKIPAKLSRSKLLAWLLLILLAATGTCDYCQKHTVLQATQQEFIPSIASGVNIAADYRAIDERQQASLASRQNESSSDYHDWNQKTARDIEQAVRITASGGISDPITMLRLPEVVDMTNFYGGGFVDYREAADAVRADLACGDFQSAKSDYEASKKTLSTEVYPVAQQLFETGMKGLQIAAMTNRGGWTATNDALLAESVLLIAFLAWQYVFILLKCKIILQGTVLALLFSIATVAGTYQCDRMLDKHFAQAYQQDVLQLQSAQPFAAAQSFPAGDRAFSTTTAHSASPMQFAEDGLQRDLAKGSAFHDHLLAVALALLFAAGLSYSQAVARASKVARANSGDF